MNTNSTRHAAALGLTLVILSNGLTLFTSAAGVDRQLVYVPWAVVLLAAACFWARRAAHLSWADVGLRGAQWRRSATIGTLTGLLLAVPPLIFLLFPFLLAEPARYREIQNLDAAGLLWRLGVELTIATALTEELLFRGILQAEGVEGIEGIEGVEGMRGRRGRAFCAFLCLLRLLYLGSLVVVGIGGVIFSILRERTNHLAGSIAAHWVAVAAMTILIYLR